MPEAFRIELTPEKLGEIEGALKGITNGVNRAIAGAINKVVAKGRTQVKRGLLELTTIKSSNLEKRLYANKANPDKLVGSVKILGRKIGLINFKTKDTRKTKGWGTRGSGRGVTVQVYRGSSATVLPHAFIASGKSGNVHVFQRRKFGGKVGTKAGRLPIDKQGVSLFDIYTQSSIPERVAESMQADFNAQIDSQIQRLLAGK